MLKRRVISVIVGLMLLAVSAGATGIAGNAFGLSMIAPAHACSNGSATGGGC